MAQRITPAHLGRAVYKFGGYYEKASDTNQTPYLVGSDGRPIAPKLSSGRYYDAMADTDQHFIQDFHPFSFDLVEAAKLREDDVSEYKLKMLPASDADTQKIVYLPYHDKNITSTIIPRGAAADSVRYFMTDKLSGCNVYIDQRGDGELVCYHANAGHVAAAEAQATMDTMRRNAQRPGDGDKFRLSMGDYYAKVLELEEQSGRRLFGAGTTVMGFRADNGQWEFWFQTYGRIKPQTTEREGSSFLGKVADKVKGKVKGKGKEVDRKEVPPLRIIDHGRLTPR